MLEEIGRDRNVDVDFDKIIKVIFDSKIQKFEFKFEFQFKFNIIILKIKEKKKKIVKNYETEKKTIKIE